MRTGAVVVSYLVLGAAAGFAAGLLVLGPSAPKEQSGFFEVLAGREGVVHFPLPYSSPPNVVLEKAPQNETMVVESTSTSFRWKNQNPTLNYNISNIRWIARGVR